MLDRGRNKKRTRVELIGRAKMTSQFDPCSNSMQSQMELCELGSNLDLKKKKKRILGTQAPCLHVEDVF